MSNTALLIDLKAFRRQFSADGQTWAAATVKAAADELERLTTLNEALMECHYLLYSHVPEGKQCRACLLLLSDGYTHKDDCPVRRVEELMAEGEG